jgi:tetratricopeptide (TPR) repeat protein
VKDRPKEIVAPMPEMNAETETLMGGGRGVIRGDRGLDTAQVWISAFLIVVVGFIAFLGTWNIPFHGIDQERFVTDTSLQRIVTCPDAIKFWPYAPLTVFVFALNGWLFGHTALGYHTVNLLLHLVNAVLLYLLARRILGKGTPEPVAMLAGILFAVFPMSAETVGFLSSRASLQGLFFALLCALTFLRAVEDESINPYWMAASVSLYILGVGSSFEVVFLPVALRFLPGLADADRYSKDASAVVFGVVTVFLLCVLFLFSGTPIAERLARVGLPIFFTAFVLAGCMLILLLPLRRVRSMRTKFPGAGALMAWFTFLEMGSILFRERSTDNVYVEVTMLSVLLPLAIVAAKYKWLKSSLMATVVLIGVVCAYNTYSESALLQNPEDYWGLKAQKDPSGVSERYLARYLSSVADQDDNKDVRQEHLQAAEAAWRQVLAKDAKDAEALSRLGAILCDTNRADEALPMLKDALRYNAFDREAAERVGFINEVKARMSGGTDALREAMEYFGRAERLGGMSKEALSKYGMTLAGLGNLDEALPRLKKAAEGDPNSPLNAMSKQFEDNAGQMNKMYEMSEQQMAQKPSDLDGYLMRGEWLAARHEVMQAAYLFESAMQKHSDNTRVWVDLGYTRARMNQEKGFVAEWGKAHAEDADAWKGLASRCLATGLGEAAVAYLDAGPKPENAPAAFLRAADLALEMKQPQLAVKVLQQAADANKDDAAPWLKLCDVALVMKDNERASGALAEAEKRNAPAQEVDARRKQLSGGETVLQGPVRNIIQ